MKGLGRRMIVISGCSAIELKLTGAEIIRFECFKDCQFELSPYQIIKETSPLQVHLPSVLTDGLVNNLVLWTLVPF